VLQWSEFRVRFPALPNILRSAITELVGRKNSGSGLENRKYGRRDPPHYLPGTLLSSKVGSNFADKWWSVGSLAD
jgi:hypothetical protein